MIWSSDAVAGQFGIASNDNGLVYSTDPLTEDESNRFEGVLLYVIHREVQISLLLFENIMLRYFQVAQQSAQLYQDPVLESKQWHIFLNNMNQLEQRVHLAK